MTPEHMFEYCEDALATVEGYTGISWDEMIMSYSGVEIMEIIISSGVLPVADTCADQINILEQYVRRGKVILELSGSGILISTDGHAANGENLTEAIEELR